MFVYVCSVEDVPSALNHARVAVVLEALQSHMKHDNAANDAATLFALLATSVSTKCNLLLDYLSFTTSVTLFTFAFYCYSCAYLYFLYIHVLVLIVFLFLLCSIF